MVVSCIVVSCSLNVVRVAVLLSLLLLLLLLVLKLLDVVGRNAVELFKFCEYLKEREKRIQVYKLISTHNFLTSYTKRKNYRLTHTDNCLLMYLY